MLFPIPGAERENSLSCEKHNKAFVYNCYKCLKPLCPECVSISRQNQHYCFQCAMALSLQEETERQKAENQEAEQVLAQAGKKKLQAKKILLYLAIGIIILEVGVIIAGRFWGHGHPRILPPPINAQQQQEYDLSACVANLAGLNSAVKLYKKEHQEASPPSLTSLSVKYFKVEPTCPITNKPYLFSSNNGSYKILCPNPTAHAKKNLYFESSLGLVTEELPGGVR